jgi:hypothetical protein
MGVITNGKRTNDDNLAKSPLTDIFQISPLFFNRLRERLWVFSIFCKTINPEIPCRFPVNTGADDEAFPAPFSYSTKCYVVCTENVLRQLASVPALPALTLN